MNCKSSKNLSSEYFEGILSSERKKELEEHLGGCESCRMVFRRLSVLISLESRLPRYPVSPQFEENLFRRIGDLRSQQIQSSDTRVRLFQRYFWKPLRTRWGYGFASILLVALALFSLKSLLKNGMAPEIVESPIRIPETEVFVLEPYTYWGEWVISSGDPQILPDVDELFLLDHASYGEDTLIYTLPDYQGEIKLTSY